MCRGAVGASPPSPVRSPGVSPRDEFDGPVDGEPDDLDDLDEFDSEFGELEYADGEELDEDDAEPGVKAVFATSAELCAPPLGEAAFVKALRMQTSDDNVPIHPCTNLFSCK